MWKRTLLAGSALVALCAPAVAQSQNEIYAVFFCNDRHYPPCMMSQWHPDGHGDKAPGAVVYDSREACQDALEKLAFLNRHPGRFEEVPGTFHCMSRPDTSWR